MHKFRIGNTAIGHDEPAFVIAEIGQNHQGSLTIAKELFVAAAKAGASAVKLQKRDPRAYTDAFNGSSYDGPNSFGKTYSEHRKKLEFGAAEYRTLKAFAEHLGLAFFATPFDTYSVEFLMELDIEAYKIASGDISNYPLIELTAKSGKPLIISTGGADLAEVSAAFEVANTQNQHIALLQCTSTYPTPDDEINVSVVKSLGESFPDAVVGLSSHSLSLLPSVMAFTLGARIFEYHFTLDRSWKGSDHKISLQPREFKQLVDSLRFAQQALGDGKKSPRESELRQLGKTRKSLVAARDLTKGSVLGPNDFAIKVPGGGLYPSRLPELIGRQLCKDLAADDAITFDAVEM
ncbi:N-acetylneuraminate synthase family protein [Streptomyces sp. NPDC051362]|uniref:N-acetylneuraminate synthase family protein n=1 Tax=Streptomyces sp. NPDC051362 TaxID=3365651 RepID=UPI00379402F5